jgi:hypothetical protein
MSADLQSMLLQSLAAGRLPSMSPEDLLSQVDEDDPSRALLASLLLQQQAAPTTNEEPDDERWPEERHAEPTSGERRLLRRLEHTLDQVQRLEQRNDSFAAAVGACYLCWGEDLSCAVCGGNGQSGAFEPDAGLFAELVAPALQRIDRRHETGRPASAARVPPADEHETSTKGGVG